MPDVAVNNEQHLPEVELKSTPKRGPRGRVVIFGMWCKGCRLCIELCPTKVLALGENEQVIVVKPENCTACHWCDTHCPDLAIVVKKIDE
jgi:2-oxoglutarate ferredoxin oxidoreductase subunit delta